MLKVMRDQFHNLKWILLAVVAAFIIGFVFIDMGLGGAAGGKSNDNTSFAARVNGETISYAEFNRALYSMEENYKRMYGQQFTPEMAQAMGLDHQVLDMLIERHLLLQQAAKLHLSASSEEVRKKILELPVLSPEGKFVGPELYQRFVVGQLHYESTAAFEDDLAHDITLEKMESAMSSSLIVSAKAAEDEYRRNTENARIRYVLVSAQKMLPSVTVTPAEVDLYYAKNQAKYKHGEQRDIKYLVADTNRIRQTIKPGDEELRKRYEASKEDYKRTDSAHILHILIKVDRNATPDQDAAAKAKAEGIVKQLRTGGDFAKLARESSGDPSSSGNGGDMGFIERGQTVDAFDKAAFSIPLNTISDPIRTPEYGYHIIKVLERRPPGYRPFEEVRAQLSMQLADQTAKDTARDEMTRISARLKQSKPKTPEEFTAYANDKVSSNDSQWFGKSDEIPGLGHNQPLATWTFNAKQGDVGEIVGTQRGPLIPYVYGIRPAGISPLSDIHDRVEKDAKLAKARDLASASLASAVIGATSIDAIAAKVGATPSDVTVSRQGSIAGLTGDTSALVDAAMSSKNGDLKGPIIVGDGAIAFSATDVKKIDPAEAAKNGAGFVDALHAQQLRTLRSSLLQRLRKDSKVEINPKVLQNNSQQGA
jgi:peptidyl-prolyl cis-trans isomerase D